MADDTKTAADEKALFDEVLAMLVGGKDGVEAGLTTTEFWLVTTSVVIDVAGPHYGFLQGIDANEQGAIAMILVLGYGALRSWRKRGGPAKVIAQIMAALPGKASASAPAAPPIEVPAAA